MTWNTSRPTDVHAVEEGVDVAVVGAGRDLDALHGDGQLGFEEREGLAGFGRAQRDGVGRALFGGEELVEGDGSQGRVGSAVAEGISRVCRREAEERHEDVVAVRLGHVIPQTMTVARSDTAASENPTHGTGRYPSRRGVVNAKWSLHTFGGG